MFDAIMDSIGDSFDDLFTMENIGKGLASGLGAAAKGESGGSMSTGSVLNLLNNNLNRLSTDTSVRSANGEPTQSVNMDAIEAAWVARLAKYAGIAGASSVKLG